MKKVKKLLSILLAAVMLVYIVPITDLGIKASAGTNGHTQAEAISWAEAQTKNPRDYDGTAGIQCPDLIKMYYVYLGYYAVKGNGAAYATNEIPCSTWNRLPYYNGFIPQPGDVACWTYSSSSAGHVAIVLSADSSGMTVAEFMGSNHTGRTHWYKYSYGTLACFIRPDFNTTSTSVSVSTDKKYYSPNETAKWSFNATGANSLHLYIYKDGVKYFEGEFSSTATYSRTLYDKGHYAFYIVAHFSYGDAESLWNDCDVVNNLSDYLPASPDLWADKDTVSVDSDITIHHWSEKASSYLYSVYKDGEWQYAETHYTGVYTTSFSSPGTYSIAVQAVNSYGTSNWISLTITVFSPNFQVYFNINTPENIIGNKALTYNSQYGELPVPTREGYKFDGWFTEAEGGTLVTRDTIVTATADHTLYAHWSHDTFILKETEISTQNKLITGSQLLSMSAEDLRGVFNNTNISVNMKNSQRMATGTTVNLIDDTDTVYDTMTVVIRGDVDCDGHIDGRDSLIVDCLVNNLLSKDQVGEAVFTAADCNRNGEIDQEDIALLEGAGLKLNTIEQI